MNGDEHPVGHRTRVAPPRAADADAQAEEVLRAEVLRERAQAVVAGEPSPGPRLHPARLEVDVVVDDEHLLGLDLEEAHRRADRAAGVVHVRLRLQQREAQVAEADLRQ